MRGNTRTPSAHSNASSRGSEFRERSQSELAMEQGLTNNNVNWISNKWFWFGYLLLLLLVRSAIHIFTHSLPNSTAWGWSALNATHAALTFYALHWKRGSPIWEDQGKYIDRTVWEQVDEGVAFSDSRKFLMLVPCFLFLFSASSIQNDVMHLAFNLIILAIVIIPKLPAMEGKRLFGVNAGPGADEE